MKASTTEVPFPRLMRTHSRCPPRRLWP